MSILLMPPEDRAILKSNPSVGGDWISKRCYVVYIAPFLLAVLTLHFYRLISDVLSKIPVFVNIVVSFLRKQKPPLNTFYKSGLLDTTQIGETGIFNGCYDVDGDKLYMNPMNTSAAISGIMFTIKFFAENEIVVGGANSSGQNYTITWKRYE